MEDGDLKTALAFIKEFVPLMEKYEQVLLAVSKGTTSLEKLKTMAEQALKYGNEPLDKLEDEEYN